MSVENTLQTGLVTGRFGVGVADGPDVGDDPDVIPAQGRIIFTQTIGHQPNANASPPVTVLRVPITGILDDEGYLCTPDPSDPLKAGQRGMRLFATDDPNGGVTNWTYKVSYAFKPTNYGQPALNEHDMFLPAGSTQDLTKVAPVPSSPGYGLPQAEAAANRAEASAQASAESSAQSAQSAADAEALAQSVRDDAAAGAFDGLSAYQIWLRLGNTGTEADFITWLKGAKGDPGGWTTGTALGSTHLDTVIAPGLYYQNTSANITPANGYPPIAAAQVTASGARCEIEVANWGGSSSVMQTMKILGRSITGQIPKMILIRHREGTTFTQWEQFSSTRFNNAVGWAAYQYDAFAGAERLIAGSTGDISLAGLLLPGVTATTITVSRQSDLVTLSVRGLTVATSGSQNIFTSFPVGFRPAATQELRVPVGVGAGPIVRLIQVNGPNTWYSGANTADLLSFQVTYRTNDAWPSATPPPIA
ncbi:hypothetical protein AUR04nite_00630 [Glutamicibacter uratoxydans]|uniref:Minor tail protein n=1 Tax=Glutamicibacter uratoxydans TaxID=43667 RepID=A0A4Y4DPN1_GLUUR|nr:pyocin knob domain-containing protein [Glutamicibacter uratoxydans]GED04531.1 hypothetical protein AUR04nite_00630 [Glutamicibacter uratoxydans]